MAISLPLVLEAGRRRRTPEFGALSWGAARSLAARSLGSLADVVGRHRASADTLLFCARVHGVSGLLSRLTDNEPGTLPAEHAEALRHEREQVGARGRRLLEDLSTLGAAAQRGGLPLIPLKGAYLAAERYRDLSLRPAADIDLLAPAETFAPWARLLEESGYVLRHESWKNRVYIRPGHREPDGFGEHPDNPRPVELHQRVRERFLGRFVDLTDSIVERLSDGFVGDTVTARIPDDAALALHLFAHAAPAAIGRGLRLIQLVDLTHLQPRADTVAVLREHLGEAAWGLAALFEKGLPGALPDALRAELGRFQPAPGRQLRWLSRPGLMTGSEEKRFLLLAELGLCRDLASAAGRFYDALPERAVLQNLYGTGAGGPMTYVRALGRYCRDRLA
ncbi:MAG: nucleotidyltransferase family protein [Thermoanaerobaculia bacterium]